jgi:hypothetical protein
MLNIKFYACAGLMTISAFGFAQHSGDVYVHANGGRLATGTVDEDGNVESLDSRVFAVELGENEPFFTDEPGFDSPLGVFSITSSIGFNFTGQLTKWNGSGFELTSETVTALHSIGAQNLSATTGTGFVNGFKLPVEDTGAAAGAWHRHIGWLLNGVGSNDPATGVYALKLELESTDTSLMKSREFWFILNNGDTEENHEEAIEFANTVVPEPASILALGVGLLMVGRKKKK